MTKWIRWWGLLAVAAVVALIAAVVLLLAGPAVEKSIETLGTKINGALVEVDSVTVSINPLGLEIKGIAVTDRRHPMENAVEIGQARAQLELLPLLAGHIIIEDLALTEVAFDTERSVSGALPERQSSDNAVAEAAADEDAVTNQFSASVPSLEQVLERQSLATDKAGRELRQLVEQRKPEVEQRIAQLPDEQQLQQYEQQVNALINGKIESLEDFQRKKAQLDELKQQLRRDREAVVAVRDLIRDSRDELTARLQQLRAAPAQDLAMLKQQYSLDGQGAVNLSRLLWGDEVGQWGSEALYWYQRLQPYLQQGAELAKNRTAAEDSAAAAPEPVRISGQTVHFPTADPWPEFLVRQLSLTAQLPQGRLLLSGSDLTPEPALMPQPARLTLTTEGLPQVASVTADLVLDHRRTPGRDTLTLTVRGWQLSDWQLHSQLDLASAVIDADGLAVVADGRLTAQLDAQFNQAQFQGEADNRAGKEMLAVLAQIDQFNLDAAVAGTLADPELELGSDLDRRLQQAVGERLRQQQAELQQRFNRHLNQKISGYTDGLAGDIDFFNLQDEQLAATGEQLQQLAQQQLDDYVEQQRRRAEEKAQKKVDEKTDELKRKAEDKLKSLFN
ncbi:hypothetical protein GCM10011297_02050 [Bacterioplanes sanyensis]|uniref:TIGR03545 family protein n=1 Tax=Bacterioplanes sanyensis TaxID=1249553 RepID=UPI001673ED1B|nr:TIGR03545 family protein [Bacterioplanes sanyensis]GGY32708.1 hypothetical protein GCM10011297_02050 [Bacterioplanes sanyensis]